MKNIHDEQIKVGEIVICNRDTRGKFIPIKEFTGRPIITIGGGDDKTFIVEEKSGYGCQVKSITTKEKQKKEESVNIKERQNDDSLVIEEENREELTQNIYNDQDNNMESQINDNDEVINKSLSSNEENNDSNIKDISKDNPSNQIIQIIKGKHHLIKLVADGRVFSCGDAYFGVNGLGGSAHFQIPKLIPNLSNIKVKQIVCGMNHSLALSYSGDLYSWGMGFEGQLGLGMRYKVVSSPKYVKFFFNNPIKLIACGTNFSFCITDQNSHLYGWGDNKLGQLGLGKTQIIEKPTLIEYYDSPINIRTNYDYSDSPDNINTHLSKVVNKMPLIAEYVSSGYAHTAVITKNSLLYTFGLNIYGQLGLGHNITTFEPKRVLCDENDNPIKNVKMVACNVTGTFIIMQTGELYTCGSGDIGHGEIGVIQLPKKLHENRTFEKIFCNSDSVVCFCPLKIISVSPNFGPATGNSILSIIGSAFKEFPLLRVKFSINETYHKEEKAKFDEKEKAIFVTTPNFNEMCKGEIVPSKCSIKVSFDGKHFTNYDEDFLIYSNSQRKPISLSPKCGSIEGGNILSIEIDLSGIEQKYLFLLTVGFQVKQSTNEQNEKKKIKMNKIKQSKNDNDSSRISQSFHEKTNTNINNPNIYIENKDIIDLNPMDINPNSHFLDKGILFCTKGVYENGYINCEVPKISNFNYLNSDYNVDICLNGQQFSGFPLIYKFYNISFKSLDPKNSPIEGGTEIIISGEGLFDTTTKKAKIVSSFGERLLDLIWEKNEKSLLLVTTPLKWLVSDEEYLKIINPTELYDNFNFEIFVTMNGNHWMNAGFFKYYIIKVLRVVYVSFPDKSTLEDKIKLIKAEDASLTNEEKIAAGFIPNNIEDKKKKEELSKRIQEEDQMIQTVPRRPYTGIYIYGEYFPKPDLKSNLKIRLRTEDGQYFEVENTFWKNKKKIGALIPEMKLSSNKIHSLSIEITLNNQNYSMTDLVLLHQSSESIPLKYEDYVKLEEEDIKKGLFKLKKK